MPRPAVRPETTRVFLVDGANVVAEVHGDGEWIVFVHGFPFDRTMWRHQLADFHGWGRCAPDLRGFGRSARGDGDVSMARYSDDIAALMEQARIDRAVVCGLSMGGYVALELWRRHPGRVRALVLANSRAEADGPEARAQREATIHAVREGGSAVLVDSMTPKVLGGESLERRPDVVAHVRAMIGDTHPEAAIAAVGALRDRADFTRKVEEMRLPVLVVGGEDDRIIPAESQRALARRIPGARVEILGGAGHLAPLEQPAAFNSVLASFLANLPR